MWLFDGRANQAAADYQNGPNRAYKKVSMDQKW